MRKTLLRKYYWGNMFPRLRTNEAFVRKYFLFPRNLIIPWLASFLYLTGSVFACAHYFFPVKKPITWQISARPAWDFNSVSWTNLFKKTFVITWREFQPGLTFQARFVKPGWKCQPGQTGWKTSCNRTQISARAGPRAEIWTWACAPL